MSRHEMYAQFIQSKREITDFIKKVAEGLGYGSLLGLRLGFGRFGISVIDKEADDTLFVVMTTELDMSATEVAERIAAEQAKEAERLEQHRKQVRREQYLTLKREFENEDR